MVMRDNGEPVGKGRLDRQAEDRRALRTAVFAVAFFTAVVLVNGLLAILFIALLQSLGLWGVGATETTSVSLEGTEDLRSTLAAFRHPPTLPMEA